MTNKQIPVVTMMQINEMEPAARRVLIAQDALALINSDVMRTRSSYYLYMAGEELRAADDLQMHALLERALATWDCGACALGFALVAAVRRFNELTVGEYTKGERTREPFIEYLGRFFDRRQLDLMECAFEGYVPGNGSTMTAILAVTREKFFERYPAPRDRMMAIFQNIVDNNGTFVPEENHG